MATANRINIDNVYYTVGKQTASTHWKVTCKVKRITNDYAGEAGVALVCSNGGPAGNDYFGSAVSATISVGGSSAALNLSNITPVVSDTRTSEVSLPINSMAVGETAQVTIEYNAGALTATVVPGNQQL